MRVRPVQPENAPLSILLTELGMVMLVRNMHPLNARPPILVTEYLFPSYLTSDGIVTLVADSLQRET